MSQSALDADLEEVGLRQFQQLRVGGVLVVPVAPQPPVGELVEAGTPVVVLGRRSSKFDFAAVDDVLGGQLAARHLAGLGHRRVLCVHPDQPHNLALQDRLRSFAATLVEERVKLARPITTPGVHIEDGARAAERYLALGAERPPAVFLTADHLAIGFLQQVRRSGLRVPQDVAIVGYDDLIYARHMEVPLTTVALPIGEMGRLAVQILFERAQAPLGKRQQILLAPRLVVRASCGG